jgi:hypothetical protein
LVHDFDDTLSINYVGDYPGGVRVFGTISIERLVVTDPSSTFEVPSEDRFASALRNLETDLGPDLHLEHRTDETELTVADIYALRALVRQLATRVAALESRS